MRQKPVKQFAENDAAQSFARHAYQKLFHIRRGASCLRRPHRVVVFDSHPFKFYPGLREESLERLRFVLLANGFPVVSEASYPASDSYTRVIVVEANKSDMAAIRKHQNNAFHWALEELKRRPRDDSATCALQVALTHTLEEIAAGTSGNPKVGGLASPRG